jgi:hypothetical protein
MAKPTANTDSGRDEKGRFIQGNGGGPGNPHAKRVAEVRTLLLESVTDADLQDIIKALVEKAKTGDVVAVKELLDRLLGKPRQALELDLDTSERLSNDEYQHQMNERREMRIEEYRIIEARVKEQLRKPGSESGQEAAHNPPQGPIPIEDEA